MQSNKFLTKREFAAEAIRDAIQTGFYQPGEVVSQRRISEDLNLSVTPIREAILQLAATGVVERHSHHSIRVKEVDAKRLSDIYHVRMMLELDAVRLAFANIGKPTIAELKTINNELKLLIKGGHLDRIHSLDRQFHYIVIRAAGNDALISCIEFVKSSFSFYALWSRPGRLKQSVAEHAEFIAALEAGDCDAGVAAHRNHLESGLHAALTSAAESVEVQDIP